MTGLAKRLYRGETNIDFIGRRKLWFTLSALVVLICIGSLAIKNLNFGIEFEGGVSIKAPVAEDGPLGDEADIDVIAEVRDAVAAFGADDAQVQVSETEGVRSVVLTSKAVEETEDQDRVVEAVAEAVGADIAEVDSQRTGSTWGSEITRKARNALVVFLIVVMAFISWRFEIKMAVAAIVALLHDIIITAGVYSLSGFEVTPSTVIALLTILGYSLYDTVVVFDKVEENTSLYATTGRMTYQDAANLAMNQVFMRSLNTSLATLLPVAALLIVGSGLLGAGTLEDLALALLVGILTGAYSSIYVATPLLALMKEREPKYRGVREKVLRDATRSAESAQRTAALAGAEATLGETTGASTTSKPQPRPTTSTQAARPRPGSKKAKRRKRR